MAGKTKRTLKSKGRKQKELIRYCLRCDKKFIAIGRYNRVCTVCKSMQYFKWLD